MPLPPAQIAEQNLRSVIRWLLEHSLPREAVEDLVEDILEEAA